MTLTFNVVANSGFETYMNNWTFDDTHFVQGSYNPHSGSHSCMTSLSEGWTNDYIEQTLVIPVSVEYVDECGAWIKYMYSNPTDEATVTVYYSDNTSDNHTYTVTNGWTYMDMKSYLDAEKDIVKIRIHCRNGHVIDDVILTATMPMSILLPLEYYPTTLALAEDEFDPRCPAMQLLLENFPEKKVWVMDGMYKVEHRIRLTLFLKPVRYTETDITRAKDTFYFVKECIDKTLMAYKFDIEGITNLELTNNGWNDKNSLRVGRGTKDMGTFLASIGGKDTAIVFRSETVLTAIYYVKETLVN